MNEVDFMEVMEREAQVMNPRAFKNSEDHRDVDFVERFQKHEGDDCYVGQDD